MFSLRGTNGNRFTYMATVFVILKMKIVSLAKCDSMAIFIAFYTIVSILIKGSKLIYD